MRYNAIHKLIAVTGVCCAVAFGSTGCGGGGGGGGPTASPATVTGTVLSVESGLPSSTGATVKIGGQTATTDTLGKFTLTNVSSGTTSGTVTATGELPLTLALALKPNVTNNLGTIYLSNAGYTATVTGTVVSTVSGARKPVPGATVTIANASGKTAADGTFTLTNLPVGLGATAGFLGKVTATGFEDKPITADTLQYALVAGANPIGDLLIAQPTGSVPSAPFTIQGVVTIHGAPAANVPVSLASGGTNMGSTSTDSTGTYFFWVIPATYNVTAVSTTSQSVTVTVTRLDVPVTAPTIALP